MTAYPHCRPPFLSTLLLLPPAVSHSPVSLMWHPGTSALWLGSLIRVWLLPINLVNPAALRSHPCNESALKPFLWDHPGARSAGFPESTAEPRNFSSKLDDHFFVEHKIANIYRALNCACQALSTYNTHSSSVPVSSGHSCENAFKTQELQILPSCWWGCCPPAGSPAQIGIL